MLVQVMQSQWSRVIDQQSEDAATSGQRTNFSSCGLVDSDGQELRKQAHVVDDTERSVSRVNELDGGLDDAVQNGLQIKAGANDKESVEQAAVYRTVLHRG
jgi:hypothetical protein